MTMDSDYLSNLSVWLELIFQSFYWCQLQDIFEGLQLFQFVLILKNDLIFQKKIISGKVAT